MTRLIIGIALFTLIGFPSRLESSSSTVRLSPGGIQKSKTIRIKCQPVVEINKNDTLVIGFVQYPGRAYSWELMNADSSLINLKLVKIYRHDPANRPDSQEKVEFFFHGLKEGEESLTFKYFRPWERSKPAADSCIIEVIIK